MVRNGTSHFSKSEPEAMQRFHPDQPTDSLDVDGQPVSLERAICDAIRSGGYGHIAAVAAGLPEKIYQRWMKRGQRKGQEHQRFRQFRQRVLQAQAAARLKAEQEVFATDTAKWLRYGPGKDPDALRGWTGTVRPEFEQRVQINLLATREGSTLIQTILAALAPHPEAKLAAAQAIKEITGGDENTGKK